MIIRVKITRPENRNYFDVTDGEIVHVDLDDYAAGVLAGEVYASWLLKHSRHKQWQLEALV